MADDLRQFEVTVNWVDFEQEFAKTQFYVETNLGTGDGGNPIRTFAQLKADVDALINLMANATNMVVSSRSITFHDFDTRQAPAKAGKYPSAEDKLRLIFADADGRANIVMLPAPKDTDLLDDQETYDPTNGAMAAIITAWTNGDSATPDEIAIVVSKAGSHIQELDYGYRTRSKSRSERPGRHPAIG